MSYAVEQRQKIVKAIEAVVTEIKRHRAHPISEGRVWIPILAEPALAVKLNAEIAFSTKDLANTHRVIVEVCSTANANPVNLRGRTCLMYVYQPREDDHPDLIKTMELTLSTAKFKGLGGHIVRV
jgi:hypothetical protein